MEELEKMRIYLDGLSCMRFRGVNESKYTMLTSLQRKCPASMKDHQIVYMTELLNRVKSNAEVITYFRNNNIAINDITCLALMQHHCLPTPLLDFSTNINIALSFAALDINMNSGYDEIDKYVSLYYFDKVFEHEVGISIQHIINTGMTSGIQKLQDYRLHHPNESVNASILYDINEFISWNDIKELELAYIEYQPLAPNVETLSGQSLNIANPNHERQKGCFIFNLCNESMPLEENWNKRTIDSRNRFCMNKGASFSQFPFSGIMTKEKISCLDIKKDVIKRWSEKKTILLYDNSQANLAIKQKLQEILEEMDGAYN